MAPSSSKSPPPSSDAAALLSTCLRETNEKVVASLVPKIAQHTSASDGGGSSSFKPEHGLDFLDAKNSLLLSYLIDLTANMRRKLLVDAGDRGGAAADVGAAAAADSNRIRRLTEMKVCLDKVRGLDKKLRYQIDKLLTAAAAAVTTGGAGTTSSSNFAAAGGGGGEDEDPLQFRPNAAALLNDDDDDDDDDASSSNSGSDDDDGDGNGGVGERDDAEEDHQSEDDLDDDLEAARLTLSMAKGKKKRIEVAEDDAAAAAAPYRAPRLAAVPYGIGGESREDRDAEIGRRQRRKMKASEVAMTLRSQYGDAPDREDAHGGAELGRQRDAARRMAAREAEKTRFEEDNFVRLTTTRKERKERERLMRQESSNLAAIADVVRGAGSLDFDEGRNSRGVGDDGDDLFRDSGRHANGKRKRQLLDRDGKAVSSSGGSRKKPSARNSLQAALFGGGGGKSSKNKKATKKRNSY